MRSWWPVGVIAACGPSVAVQDVDSSVGASSGDTAATTSTGTTVVSTASTATGVDDSSSDDTASGPRRCIATIAIDIDYSTYVGAARLRPDGPLRLLFRENADVLRDGRIYPAIDVVASGTRREDLLMSSRDLRRMWILRKYLSDMNSIESMEFLIDRMRNTLDNQEFLLSMNG